MWFEIALNQGMAKVSCPSCKTKVAAKVKTFPFCSARCHTIDLGRWLDEDFRMPAEESAPSEFDLNQN